MKPTSLAAMLVSTFTALILVGSNAAAGERTPLRIGFVDPALPGPTPERNAAALEFAATQGQAVRIRPGIAGGWQNAETRPAAPEEFDVVWFHQGDDPRAAVLPEGAVGDLYEYVELGGVLLVSGAAGRLVNDLGIEPTPARILPPTAAAYLTGLRVVEKHRNHPAFTGLDTSKVIMLTSLGGNALADFYDTAGPHGDLLADRKSVV